MLKGGGYVDSSRIHSTIETRETASANIASLFLSPFKDLVQKYTEVPYRIYIDSGYIFSCLTALAPVCPLVGTFGVCYYIAISPMLRWLLVFGYRPRFDGGGE